MLASVRRSGARFGCAALAVVGLVVLTQCSSPAEDGDSCSKDSGCSSNRCVNGACEGSDCTCDTADCHSQSSCQSGWLCTRGDAVATGDVLPQCRKECMKAGDCTADKHCANSVCRLGPESFGLTWVSFPRTVACPAKIPCKYEVKPSTGTNVTKYTWTFGDAMAMDTTTPTNEFTYDTAGSYDVKVLATADTGATAMLEETEVLCDGVIGGGCDVNGAACCQGRCNAMNTCQ